ncbi:ATP-binding protein [Candidatus Lokiarchaeum ossiferum]|uniref:ATP-binding protein n=1 Tax=Candidatus Lokiarchaeum ossiferum TaxID=2951803 RepID=UPI00352E8F51
MEWLIPSIIMNIISSLILCLVLLYLYIQYRENYLKYWAIAWIFYVFRFVFALLISIFGESPQCQMLNQFMSLLSGLFLYFGAKGLVDKKIKKYTHYWFGFIIVWIIVSTILQWNFYLVSIPPFFTLGVIYCIAGIDLLRHNFTNQFGQKLTGISLICWGLHKFNYPFLRNVDWFAPIGFILGSILGMCVTFGIFITYYEVERFKLIHLEHEYVKHKNLKSLNILAGGIAHDFNNLLAVIQGNSQILAFEEALSPSGKESLDEITQALKKSQKLTSQLLTFSKGGTPIKELGRIDSILEEIGEFHLRGSNVAFFVHAPSDLWYCEFDPSQISQVFSNMIINAKQAVTKDGKISCQLENLHLNENKNTYGLQTGNYVKISIKDNGCGIPQDIQENIFSPYFTTKEKGNGLGLTICYSIVDKHKGKIFFNSIPNQSTEFVILLPAQPTAEVKQLPDPARVSEKEINHDSISNFHGLTVLIMDDEDKVLHITQRLTEIMGFKTILAHKGEEVISHLENDFNSIDLMILDLTIKGGKGGLDVLDYMQSNHIIKKTIISSGYIHSEIIKKYKEKGFLEILKKPFSYEELQKTLTKCI